MATYFGIDFGTTNCAVHAITAIGDGIDDEFDIGETDRRPLPSFVIENEVDQAVDCLMRALSDAGMNRESIDCFRCCEQHLVVSSIRNSRNFLRG